jgi:hypothetical protein
VKKSNVRKKAGAGLPYDIASVYCPSDFPPSDLTNSENNEIKKIFGQHQISQDFFPEYGRTLEAYIRDVGLMSNATPAKVRSRLKSVQISLQKLSAAMSKLQQPDHGMINREARVELLGQKSYVTVIQFRYYLNIFKHHVDFATEEIATGRNAGRMPGYAEHILATNIDSAIYKETGAYPSLSRNGLFAKLLKIALSTGDKRIKASNQTGQISKPRKAVMELMRIAREARSNEVCDVSTT